MLLEIIPKSLFLLPNLRHVLSDKKSCILYKTLDSNLLNKEIFLTSSLIVYIVKGRQIISDHSGKKITISENSMLFLPKDIYLVSDYVVDDGTFEAYLFFYDDDLIKKYIAASNISPNKSNDNSTCSDRSPYIQKASNQILNYIKSLDLVYTKTTNTTQILELKLLELLNLIAFQDKEHVFLSILSMSDRPNKKRDISEFMEQYYSRNLKVEDYAFLTGRSVTTFIRDFKRKYNSTPNQWLIKKRLVKAHTIITKNNGSITDAAFEVGYENVSHFIQSYKKMYGVTPKKAKQFSL